MFEDNEELKLRSLNIWGFDLEKLETNRIQYVPMHQYRISSKEYPMLYIDNLQCCIGLFAYGNRFGFAAHINPIVMRGNEFELDSNKNPIYFRRIDDLLRCILESNISFTEPLKIGIAVGVTPVGEDYPTIKLINEGIKKLIERLKLIEIDTIKLENINAPQFILDVNKENIITPNDNVKNIK